MYIHVSKRKHKKLIHKTAPLTQHFHKKWNHDDQFIVAQKEHKFIIWWDDSNQEQDSDHPTWVHFTDGCLGPCPDSRSVCWHLHFSCSIEISLQTTALSLPWVADLTTGITLTVWCVIEYHSMKMQCIYFVQDNNSTGKTKV